MKLPSLPQHLIPYTPAFPLPPTASPPALRLQLCNLPTPIHNVASPIPGIKNLYLKRDDATGGLDLGGNKLRKLEFLLADALSQGYDSVVTIGGEQSNHCRATAAASAMHGFEPHLVLRCREADADPGHGGNLLFARSVGAHVHTCSVEDYSKHGSTKLVQAVVDDLSRAGKKPYAIPVGGSNAIGTWGYIEACAELKAQLSPAIAPDAIVFTCGSGGTAAGIAQGLKLAFEGEVAPKMYAVGVCDNPSYFYKYMASILFDMGFYSDVQGAETYLQGNLRIVNGRGGGYAVSSQAELDFVASFARDTGILLDPVYTGKSLYKFCSEVDSGKLTLPGPDVLFWHTGGGLGTFAQAEALSSNFEPYKRLTLT